MKILIQINVYDTLITNSIDERRIQDCIRNSDANSTELLESLKSFTVLNVK